MSTEINKAFVQQFSGNLIHLTQQKGSRLMGTVMTKEVTGKYAHFERVGQQSAQKRTSRHADTPLIDTPHSRRRVSMDDYETADLVDTQDELRMLIDPKSAYAMSMAYALGRTADDVIIAAATGNAISVDSADSGSTVALPSEQIVDEDEGTSNSGLIIEKLIEAKRIFMANDVDPDEQLYMVVNAAAHTSLLGENEIKSQDYNSRPALIDGTITQYMGFQFVHTNRLLGSGTEADPRLVLAYAKSGIGFAKGQDIKVRMSERDDKSYATQVYASMTCGATRVEDEKVVSIQCVE